jgi:hypothetical protein
MQHLQFHQAAIFTTFSTKDTAAVKINQALKTKFSSTYQS